MNQGVGADCIHLFCGYVVVDGQAEASYVGKVGCWIVENHVCLMHLVK